MLHNITVGDLEAIIKETKDRISAGFRPKESADAMAWLTHTKPFPAAVNNGINTKLSVEGVDIPIGLSVFTGGSGSGKTTLIKKLAGIVEHNDEIDGYFLRFGEPGYFIPYSYEILSRSVEWVSDNATSTPESKAPILMIDSLMGLWYDPIVTSGFSIGKGGATFGVPVLLQAMGSYALARGARIVVVLHPAFADPDVIGRGVSGVSSLYLSLDTGAYIVRDYKPLANLASDDQTHLDYTRRESGMSREGSESQFLDVLSTGLQAEVDEQDAFQIMEEDE